ncbi:hypothetical protein Pint_26573 [Pistacia integerrima]|uniref:Uncharacterized protein n=1 Tax=Pistacia integerrima TaxID=434235 RepID=A0ACC0YPH2_9ROSI|nr:hypothetical protein Pint_26573 [Pistacia integerrima]
MDFFYLIYIFFQPSPAVCLPYRRQPSFEPYHRGPANGKKYLRRFFLVDLLSILPLPQVIIFTPRNAMKLLHFFVIFQYMPRLIRIYPLFKKVKMTFYEIDDAAFTKAAFNLLLYMLASQVFGALWYFFAIERETSCWKTACLNHAGCIHSPFYCHDNLGDYTFLSDLCPVKIPNTTLFNFGIYQDALQSGIVEVTDFPLKFLHTFLWGLQSLRYYSDGWRTWAACFIQATWRRYFEKKREKSLSMERNRQDEWLRSGGISSSSGASHHTSKFALNSGLVNRCNGNKIITETISLTQKLKESLLAEENHFLDALFMARGNPRGLRAFFCAIMFAIKSLRGIRLNRIRKAKGKGIAAASVASQSSVVVF